MVSLGEMTYTAYIALSPAITYVCSSDLHCASRELHSTSTSELLSREVQESIGSDCVCESTSTFTQKDKTV